MRKPTFAIVSAIIFGIVGLAFDRWIHSYDVDWRVYIGIWLVAGSIIGGVLESILGRLNSRLLVFRKARGRDIEEEERYESDLIDHGFITLHPKDEREER